MKRVIITVLTSLLIMMMTYPANTVNGEEAEKYYFTATLVNAGKDKGYSEEEKITSKDPHFQWSLGSFLVTGHTQVTKDDAGNPVVLKSVGDKVKLSFELLQDIDALNENDRLTIWEDKNGYDEALGIAKSDVGFGRGSLFVTHADYKNTPTKPSEYRDFLSGVKVGAETEIELFEEGDYEVVLDYEIRNNPRKVGPVSIVPTYTNYRMSFKFSVRNGNCAIYPMDLVTRSELSSGDVAENGFYLDFAKSHYLNTTIKKEVLNSTADGLVEDSRFVTATKEGNEYTDEGIYTITAYNQYTNQSVEKTIIVGTNEALIATMISVDIPDEPEDPEETETTETNTSEDAPSQSETAQSAQDDNKETPGTNISLIVVVALIIVVIIGFIAVALRKKKRSYDVENIENDGEGDK